MHVEKKGSATGTGTGVENWVYSWGKERDDEERIVATAAPPAARGPGSGAGRGVDTGRTSNRLARVPARASRWAARGKRRRGAAQNLHCSGTAVKVVSQQCECRKTRGSRDLEKKGRVGIERWVRDSVERRRCGGSGRGRVAMGGVALLAPGPIRVAKAWGAILCDQGRRLGSKRTLDCTKVGIGSVRDDP